MSEHQPRRTAVGAWVVYDIANTTFWTGVVGVSFPLWLTNDMGGDDATLGYTLAATMAVVLILAPVLGAFSDQAGRRLPLLAATTLMCICTTLFIGSGGLYASLSLFALALCTMELGTIVYNALLADVSTRTNRGRVSGLGQGIGYLGTFLAVGTALAFSDSRGYVFVFRVVAVLYLIFSLPIFLLLRERVREVSHSGALDQIRMAFVQLNGNFRNLERFPGLRRFLMARLMYAIGINTAVAFAVVYASDTIGLSDREIQLVLIMGTTVAVPSAVLAGALVDRIGPRPVLAGALAIWTGLLILAVAIAWMSLTTHLWWFVGCLTGVAMAAVWTADRPFMLTFTPEQYTGEFFGLHGMIGKLGRIIGPFMWALISATLGLGQPTALLSLTGCLVLSYLILNSIKVPARALSPDLAG